MSWKAAMPETEEVGRPTTDFKKPTFKPHTVDWPRLVSIDFETYYDADYTLKKMSTSEYIRDSRFKAQMMGIKVGNGKTRVIAAKQIKAELAKFNWSTHSLLCHNTQFDGFILSHHFGVHPAFLYDSLSMARGLHSNDIGAGLDEVSIYYGGHGKVAGSLEQTLGVRNWSKALFNSTATYCANDVDEMFRIFKAMLPKMPDDEIRLIDMITRMFTSPVLKVDIPRVEAELKRELDRRDVLMASVINPALYYADKTVLKSNVERQLTGKERDNLVVKRVIGSNEKFADLLRAEGVEPPVKVSPAWLKKPYELRNDDDKFAYAFAKDDLDFTELPNSINGWVFNLDKKSDVRLMLAKQARLRTLVDVRIAVKSTTNITRAQRFLTAGANGMSLPCGYAYYRAHTGRLGGNNKMNMQNLTRGGELRLSILAPAGHQMVVQDSGQIEARVNGWLWGQDDLMDAFRAADRWDKKTMGVATGDNRDAYCRFADGVYDREITTDDSLERFVGKVCVLGLGYQMGAEKLQLTLAKGALNGPQVFFTLSECLKIINNYRRTNFKIQAGWGICTRIIHDMASGACGSFGPLNWEHETIWLPNGMALKYPNLRQTTNEKDLSEWSYKSGLMRKKIYGGLLCENIVQALARIIVMWQSLQINQKYRVVMSTHDEAVAIAKTAQAQKCLDYMAKCMSTPLPWCADIPLNCEGGFAANYSK